MIIRKPSMGNFRDFWVVFVLFVLTLGLTAVINTSPAQAVWAEPTAPPPDEGGTGAPLNTGSMSQGKAGGLNVQGGITTTNICLSNSCISQWPAIGDLFWTSSSQSIFNTNSGNVGIGTSNPQAKLQISQPYTGDDIEAAFIYLNGGGDSYQYSGINLWDEEVDWTTGANGNYLWGIQHRKDLDHALEINGKDNNGNWITALTILPKTGYIGANTINPRSNLEVNGQVIVSGSGAKYSLFDSKQTTNSIWNLNNDAGEFRIFTQSSLTGAATDRIRIDSSGNVGIPNILYGVKLNVSGTVAVNQLCLAGVCKTSWPTSTSSSSTTSTVSSQWTSTTGGIYYNSGNVGIGTAAPRTKSEISFSSGGSLPNINWVGQTIYRSDALSDAYGAGLSFLAYQNKGSILSGGGFGLSISTYDGSNAPTERMRVSSSGNVGIGTNSPSSLLHIFSPSLSTVFESSNGSGNQSISVKSGSRQLNIGFGSSTNAGYIWSNSAVNNLMFGNDGVPAMYISGMDSSSTKVGIGTSNPQAKLQISQPKAGSAAFLYLSGSGDQYQYSGINLWDNNISWATGTAGYLWGIHHRKDSNHAFEIVGKDNNNAWITPLTILPSTGFVGINTTNPRSRMEVNGPILTSGYGARLSMSDGLQTTSTIWIMDNYGGFMRIFTQPDIASTGTERLRIDKNGSVDILGSYLNVYGKVNSTQLCISGICRNSWDSVASSSQWTSTTGAIYYNSGNVGIGTSTPAYKLGVAGSLGANQICIAGDCKNAWPSASTILPSGTYGQTLRNSGAAWVVDSNLYNNGIKVGIGTTSPSAKLDVQGGAVRIGRSGFVSGQSGDLTISRESNPGTGAIFLGNNSSRYLWFDGTNYQFGGSSLYANTNGRVGIGTTSPLGLLGIGTGASGWTVGTGDAATGAWLRNDGSNTVLSTNVGNLYLGYGGNVTKVINIGSYSSGVAQITGNAPAGSLIINSSGNVGIGKSPATKLDIQGTFNASGNSTIGGTLNVTGSITSSGSITGTSLATAGAISGSSLNIGGNATITGTVTGATNLVKKVDIIQCGWSCNPSGNNANCGSGPELGSCSVIPTIQSGGDFNSSLIMTCPSGYTPVNGGGQCSSGYLTVNTLNPTGANWFVNCSGKVRHASITCMKNVY